MPVNPFDPDATYFMRRLAAVRRAQGLTASMAFDLARSPLPDDQLEEVIEAFDGGAPGWGLSDLLADLLSREPRKVHVRDLRALQRNLILQGYAPPGARPSGVWDPSWQAAFRRFDRDAREEQLRGHHPGAAPVEAGVRLITQTLPSQVWRNLVGAARGLVEQAPETAERLGALGGAAAGAAIGATVGGPVGALVGGIGGAAVGFFADLLGEDETEEPGRGWGARLADALSPFEEYASPGGARRFFEDLGFVLT
ncbi:MAG TPA: hypothetical protein VNO79_02615, partial [Actinomycetota bacterium]|nr:hypothetical protein [Actinomycetota bacterium]